MDAEARERGRLRWEVLTDDERQHVLDILDGARRATPIPVSEFELSLRALNGAARRLDNTVNVAAQKIRLAAETDSSA